MAKGFLVMRVFKGLSALSIAIAALTAPVTVHAQAPSDLVRSASIVAPKEESGLAGKWTCMSATTVEIAPVSFDARGLASAWVRVYRDRGEIVAAERISRNDIEQIRRLPCGTPDSDLGGIALVG